jgi:fluoride exporter
MKLRLLLLIAGAGALGSLARYALSGWVYRIAGERFPWGTLAVNLLGCLLFGFVWSAGFERRSISPEARTVLLTGFMGAFTTFSTFAFETHNQMIESQWSSAGLNVLVQVLAGILLVYAGIAAGRLV